MMLSYLLSQTELAELDGLRTQASVVPVTQPSKEIDSDEEQS